MKRNLSDVEAKQAVINFLVAEKGFDRDEVKVAQSPADIIAFRDGEAHYFEVKWSHPSENKNKNRIFGAATLTEWMAAMTLPNYTFVLALKTEDGEWVFKLFTPEEFMGLSTIPPAKIFFNIKIDDDFNVITEEKASNRKKKAISLTEENLYKLGDLFKGMAE